MKKGSLQLSINAIVILILAITILGLGLGFIRGQFGTLQGKFDEVSSQIENQVIEDIEKSGDLLSFSKLTFSGTKAGTPNEFFFGIKSTESTLDTCFYVQFVCENAIGQSCPDGSTFEDLGSTSGNAVPSGWNWFNTLQGSKVTPGDVKVLKAILQATNAPSATYNGKVIVWKHTQSATDTSADETRCFNVAEKWPESLRGDGTTNPTIDFEDQNGVAVQLHDSKEFFIDLI